MNVKISFLRQEKGNFVWEIFQPSTSNPLSPPRFHFSFPPILSSLSFSPFHIVVWHIHSLSNKFYQFTYLIQTQKTSFNTKQKNIKDWDKGNKNVIPTTLEHISIESQKKRTRLKQRGFFIYAHIKSWKSFCISSPRRTECDCITHQNQIFNTDFINLTLKLIEENNNNKDKGRQLKNVYIKP